MRAVRAGAPADFVAELRGRRWRADEARRVLSVWRASGLSARAFGGEHGLDPQRLCWWRKRFDEAPTPKRKRKQRAGARLVPAVVQASAPTSASSAVVIRVPGGLVVEADVGVSPVWLASLLGEISRR